MATAGAVIALARKYRVQMPVLTAVARILDNELTPKKAVLELMSLPQVRIRPPLLHALHSCLRFSYYLGCRSRNDEREI